MIARLALLALALAGCSAPPVTPQRGAGPPTIVSLNPCSDAILAEVADPAQILAISHYSHDPRATSMELAVARRFAVTGGSAEEVLELRPDVVVAGSFLAPSTARALDNLGIRVETVGIASTIAESEGQVRQLAALVGHPERGEALIARIEAAVARTTPPKGTRPVTALMWQAGGLVPGEGALVSELLQRSGFASQSAARGLGQGAYLPLERVLADPPELILTAGGERMLDHPALARLRGVRVARFDPALLYCGGPTIIRALDRLAQVRGEMAS